MVRQGVRQTWLARAFKTILAVCRMLAQARRPVILQVGLTLLVRGLSLLVLLKQSFFKLFLVRQEIGHKAAAQI